MVDVPSAAGVVTSAASTAAEAGTTDWSGPTAAVSGGDGGRELCGVACVDVAELATELMLSDALPGAATGSGATLSSSVRMACSVGMAAATRTSCSACTSASSCLYVLTMWP